MKSKTPRSVNAGSGRKKVPSEVSPSTSLPPLVEGHLRCFLRVTVSKVEWTVHKPPTAVFVRLRWWGESSDGTDFFPREGLRVSQKIVKTVLASPSLWLKAVHSYLADMGSLFLEVRTKLDHLLIARAQVAGISRLSVSHPISGFYALVSPTSERFGDLQVSFHLEPLTETYDCSSSVPSADLIVQGPQATLTLPSQPRPLSFVSKVDTAGNCSGNALRGIYSQTTQKKGKDSLENQTPTKKECQNSQTTVNPSSQEPCQDQTINNAMSVILDHGNKLRNAILVSPSKHNVDSATALKDTPVSLSKDNILPHSRASPPPSGMLLENVLRTDSKLKHSGIAALPDCFNQDSSADSENLAVDLFIGRLNTSPQPLWDVEGSYLDSLSGCSTVGGDSTLFDLQYDQSLLENLFYRSPMSNIGQDNAEGEDHNTKSLNKWNGKKSSDWGEKELKQCGAKVFGGPNSEHHESLGDVGLSPGLSAKQMTHLNLIRLAKVTIDSLTVSTGTAATIPRNTSNRGKPPQPFIKKKCSYFVEYMFPVPSTSSCTQASGQRKVTRAVSSKVTEGEVKFHHHSVFPVKLSTTAIKRWLETDLIFKIYLRRSNQMNPVAIGKAVHPLRCLLQHKELSQSLVLPVLSEDGNGESQDIGPLKVLLELAADNQGLQSDKRDGRSACSATLPSRTICSPPTLHSSRSQPVDSGSNGITAGCLPSEGLRLGMWNTQKVSEGPSPQPGFHASARKLGQQIQLDSQILLHTLLVVPNGKNFDCGPMQAPNVYLNCKVFWNDEMATSVISWGQTNPSFNFIQVTPVTLTTTLLERMKNNVMVIEVWQKTRNAGNDRLLGLVKLPLHQFYMSFRDPKIVHLLLQAQYPVLAVDGFMPVMDVFSGTCKGNLRVVLAMGRSEQIIALQRTRDEEYDSLSPLVRPVHLLDHQPHSQTTVFAVQEEAIREHRFVIKVEKVIGLMPVQSTVWGEADCYIQYAFPSQEGKPVAKIDHNLIESSVNLKTFRTTTTLCVPDPVFGHSESHVLFAPEGVPVQRLLLSSLSSQGLSSGGGVHFEVWCRYYYPNVRDQLVAKGLLPLSKLCALVTMQREQHNEAQMFSLPLVPRFDNPTSHHPQPSGLLDVSINYKHRAVKPDAQIGRGAASRVVTLVVQVHRATGLHAAARKLSERDESLQYYALAGVNTYVTVQFSFLPERERRCTRIVAKTFCPEFDHNMEVSCDLLVQRKNTETCSLAEQLDEGFAIFTVWNRENPKGLAVSNPKTKDVMLGFVKISCAELIHKTTGISGWFGVYLPGEPSTSKDLVGGLEISMNFLRHSDRERVIQAARSLGSEITQWDSKQQDEEVWEDSLKTISLTFSVPQAWIPLHCLLLPDHSELMRSTYCYFRYKFYDHDAFCSPMKHPSVEESGEESLASVAFQESRTFLLRATPPLMWYLREERFEIQVWVAFKKEKTKRPRDTDRLVGSAFVDLSSLGKTTKQSLRLSGVYPLFRRAASDLHGAALRVHISLTTDCVPAKISDEIDNQVDTNSEGEILSDEMEAANHVPSPPAFKQSQTGQQDNFSRTTEDITSVQHVETSMDESFAVTVAVDRAMHLSLKGCPLAERSGGMPCCCVSYVTADSAEPVSTSVITNSDCPVWVHQQECRLSKQLLVDPQQSLVFKVWHKGEMERVIGFASVDLSPLLCGFQSVCGWYNITGFSGQCHGQLKVSITPRENMCNIQGQTRRSVTEEVVKTSSDLCPLTYHTTATYSSFPSHISQYLEQKISSSDHREQQFTARSPGSDRHDEHMDKVRLYHQSLHEQTATRSECSSTAVGNSPSTSVLFSALRKNLSELDNIQKYFSHKLLIPEFPPMKEQHSRTDPEQTPQGHHLSSTAFDIQRNSSSPPTGDDDITLHISRPTTPSESSREDTSPLPSPLTRMCEDHVCSGAEEQKDCDKYINTVCEDENNEDGDIIACKMEEEIVEDDEDSDDFVAVVVNPRHLNEVTSVTDKTSPWTSILSDTEAISETCLESSDDPDLTEHEETQQSCSQINQADEDQTENHKYARVEESIQTDFDALAGDTSDSRRHGISPLDLHEGQGDEPNGSEQKNCEGSSSSQETIMDGSHSPHNQDTQLQHLNPVEVPNFFLPPHQLEASLRAIRLAPSFSQPFSDTGLGSSVHIPHRKGPRQSVMSPSSMKKETARIAKIFTTHFNEDH
ncbi:C2 domain-containing protein 3 isoform X2 [Thalassophryne amazonica]|uniref:C2 domain-containing protein 3 isoform X2 n=1 Tax=Thalassophryne amazonica TaxID=390379 RepID=UPI001472671F|nr:C2 domain-containing protein 3 isoform X2 [Thalassophryne amazonica]